MSASVVFYPPALPRYVGQLRFVTSMTQRIRGDVTDGRARLAGRTLPVVGIDLIADPERISELDLTVLGA